MITEKACSRPVLRWKYAFLRRFFELCGLLFKVTAVEVLRDGVQLGLYVDLILLNGV